MNPHFTATSEGVPAWAGSIATIDCGLAQCSDIGGIAASVCHGEQSGIVDFIIGHIGGINGAEGENRILFCKLGQIDRFTHGKGIIEDECGTRAWNLIDRAIRSDRGTCCLERVDTLYEIDARAIGGDELNPVDRYSVDGLARNMYRNARCPVIGVPARSRDIQHNGVLRMGGYEVRQHLPQMKAHTATADNANYQHAGKDDRNVVPRLYPKLRISRDAIDGSPARCAVPHAIA